ncbi:hypothetical protein ACH5RR_023415 [Cinchona calisaya]|uniref:Uncharacterized protein n=1 Tax=Cinchona calisaya TaxID=153742 RepID=A0ABD2ZFN5_9GENT
MNYFFLSAIHGTHWSSINLRLYSSSVTKRFAAPVCHWSSVITFQQNTKELSLVVGSSIITALNTFHYNRGTKRGKLNLEVQGKDKAFAEDRGKELLSACCEEFRNGAYNELMEFVNLITHMNFEKGEP